MIEEAAVWQKIYDLASRRFVYVSRDSTLRQRTRYASALLNSIFGRYCHT